MNYNYHTHTKRCRHASGEVEEYVLRAIEGGIKYLGFSDHVPLKFKDGSESVHRVPVCEAMCYREEITALKEKYKDKIDIKIGFEAEYYPEYFDEILKNALNYGAEYLILGQHFLGPENMGNKQSVKPNGSAEDLKLYVSTVIEAMKTGAFTYVAHPDMFNFTGDEELYLNEMRKICVLSRELNIPIEINFLGIRGKRAYPNKVFWKMAGEEKCPVVFGADAHEAQVVFDGESLETAQKMVAEFGLNYIGKPEIKDIRCL